MSLRRKCIDYIKDNASKEFAVSLPNYAFGLSNFILYPLFNLQRRRVIQFRSEVAKQLSGTISSNRNYLINRPSYLRS